MSIIVVFLLYTAEFVFNELNLYLMNWIYI